MRKMLYLLVICVFFLSGFGVVGLSEVKSERVSVSFSNLIVNEKDEALSLELDGSNFMFIKENYYVLPAYIETFTYPLGTVIEDVVVVPKDIQEMVLEKKLCIAPQPVIMGYNLENVEFEESADVLSVDFWYDYDIGTGLYNGERSVILKVLVYPVQYKPEKNMIKWAKEIKIFIRHKSVESKDFVYFDDLYDLLILGPEEFNDELDDLIAHKTTCYVPGIFVSLENVYNGVYFPVQGRDYQEQIKYFIKDAIENWHVKYVLLVGDNESFPTRRSHVYMDDWDYSSFVSDLYYADVYNSSCEFCSWDSNGNDIFGELNVPGVEDDEVDLYPDIYLGRLACANGDEVSNCVKKIVDYESNKAYTKHWFTNYIGIGGDTHIGDTGGIDEGEYVNDVIVDFLDCVVPIRLYASLDMLSGLMPTGSARITDNINSGCGFLNFIGHGATWGYGTHPHNDSDTWLPTPKGYYYSSDVLNLANYDGLPIVCTSGCDVGKFHEDSNCFSWAFVKNPVGGGIASCGASAVSYGGSGYYAPEIRVGKMIVNIFDSYYQKAGIGSEARFGEIWGEAVKNYIYPGMNVIDYKVIESWEPFGDPSLMVAEESQLPLKPAAPIGEISGKINKEYTYTTSTTDPDSDDLFYLFDWGDGSYSEWVGSYMSGEEASSSHKWTEQGSYDLRVKAKDIHGVQSEWSDPTSVSMPRPKTVFPTLILRLFERFQILERLINLLK